MLGRRDLWEIVRWRGIGEFFRVQGVRRWIILETEFDYEPPFGFPFLQS